MKAIQKFLRHKQLATTERYVQNIHTDLESTAQLLEAVKTEEQNEEQNLKFRAPLELKL